MMNLYIVIRELSETDYQELHNTFVETRADKTAAFLGMIRKNPVNPEKEFLTKYEISDTAFYVLKSRLNTKVEEYLSGKLGKDWDLVARSYKATEKAFEIPRQTFISTLNQLERELIKLDFPYSLVTVYKLLQNLHLFENENFSYYQAQYKKQVAYTLAIDSANDHLMQFFRTFDNYLLNRKTEDYQMLLKLIEKLEVVANMYESHRLYIFKVIAQLYGVIFLNIEKEYKGNLESTDIMFDKVFDILNTHSQDAIYKHLHLLFNFLRYSYLEKYHPQKAQRHFEVLDHKIEELMTNYHLNAQTALFLDSKIRHHARNQSLPRLLNDTEKYLSNLSIDVYRPSYYILYHLFLAKVQFMNGEYAKSNKILFSLKNAISSRKYTHADLEVRFLMTLGYVLTKENDIAETHLRSIQRQLRSEADGVYENAKILAKIITVVSGQRSTTRRKNLLELIPQWKELNVGKYQMLDTIDLEEIFLNS